jgi:DNA repair protein RecO (recombination protein O)
MDAAIEGVVLHCRNFGESNRVVELLSPERGRVDLLARGGRASKRRFAGALDVFVSLRGEVSTRGNMWTLLHAQVERARPGIRRSLEAIGRGSRIVEAAHILTPTGVESTQLHAVVCEGLDRLDRGDTAGAVEALPALFVAAGFFAPSPSCTSCGGELRPATLTSEGLACARCAPRGRVLSEAAQSVWLGESCDDESIANEVESRAVELLEAHVGRPLRSRALDF